MTKNFIVGAHLVFLLLPFIVQAAVQTLPERREQALQTEAKKWVAFTGEEKKEAVSLLKSNGTDVVSQIKRHIRVIAVTTNQSSVLEPDLPEQWLTHLPEPDQAESALLEKSKLLDGRAMGKFLCAVPPVIAVNKLTTKTALIHEYLHWKQSQKNKSYCPAVTDQEKIATAFKAGNISKDKFEQTLIRYQAINHIAEHEVYAFLNNQEELVPKLERLNNSEMLQKYYDPTEQRILPSWLEPLFESCTEKKDAVKCAEEFNTLLEATKNGHGLWGNAAADYKAGLRAVKGSTVKISVIENKNQEGEFNLLSQSDSVSPEIVLSMSYSLPEMIITLRHELAHFANAGNLIKIRGKHSTTTECISDYDQAVLKDENQAFQSEISFWKDAPAWYTNLFGGISFTPKLMNRKMTYPEYFTDLEQQFKKDPLFASKRYIELGKYPACALTRKQ